MKQRPILFSGEMVQAVLSERKTQTRRVLDRMEGFKVHQFGPSDTRGYDWHFRCQRGMWQDMDHAEVLSRCHYGQIGDRLWVREAWAVANIYDGVAPSKICQDIPKGPGRPPCKVAYPASGGCVGLKGRPSIHMPRWASRITLKIESVAIERLQDISERDAHAEGVTIRDVWRWKPGPQTYENERRNEARCEFSALWKRINGENSWTANPFVWVVGFKRMVAE